MPAPLLRLRRDLLRLRRRRSIVRSLAAAATIGTSLLAGLFVVFAVDFLLDLQPLPRAVLLVAVAGTFAWFAGTIVTNLRRSRESLTDVALRLERRQAGARDLVAALQFQSSEAPTWGSRRLEEAVIGSVDDASRDLDPFGDFSWRPLPRRAALFAAMVGALVLLTIAFPRYSVTFLQRLMLAEAPWPTRTTITHVTINGQTIDLASNDSLRYAAGTPLDFHVETGGVTPPAGAVSLKSPHGEHMVVALDRLSESTSNPPEFSGTLSELREPASFVLRLGDATTRPRHIELMARPTIAVDLLTTPPAYARSNAPAAPPEGVRTAYVLEGSSVAIRVRGINKPLEHVSLTIMKPQSATGDRAADLPEPASESAPFPLEGSSDGKLWTFNPAATPFEQIEEPIEFTITAIDRDRLSPGGPISGSIRLRPDRPPRVVASTVVSQVLPAAKPTLAYGASDDFGVGALRARIAVNRTDGSTGESTVPLPLPDDAPRDFQGRTPFDLTPFTLAKGDRVVVTVEAEDVRGDRPGEIATAEPLTFEVTDRAGLLATLLEADEDSADRLDAIIRRELGIGEQR